MYILLLLALITSVRGWQPDFILRVSNTTLYSDFQPRESVVINGTHPAPLLRMKEGEHYWIKVYNDLHDQNTTLHWHGFSQFASPFSDGTPATSRWPIPPGHFFDYEFQLQDGFYGTYCTYPSKLGEVLDFIIENRAGPTSGMVESHSWHAHGAKYWDMGAAIGNLSYPALNASRATSKGKLYLRDTSVAYPGPGASYNSSMIKNDGLRGWRLFRNKVDDPGAWLIQCHITPHQVMGMQAVFVYGAEELPSIPDSLAEEYLTFGGGAYGKPTYDYVPRSYFAEVPGRNIEVQ